MLHLISWKQRYHNMGHDINKKGILENKYHEQLLIDCLSSLYWFQVELPCYPPLDTLRKQNVFQTIWPDYLKMRESIMNVSAYALLGYLILFSPFSSGWYSFCGGILESC